MAKTTFEDFMNEVEAEAKAQGPEAVAELDALSEHFRLARELFEARKAQGLTQPELAKRSGINQSEISDIERGRANPTFATLQRLATPLGRRISLVMAKAPKVLAKAASVQRRKSVAGRVAAKAKAHSRRPTT